MNPPVYIATLCLLLLSLLCPAHRLDAPLMGWRFVSRSTQIPPRKSNPPPPCSTWESLAKTVSDAHIMRNIAKLKSSGLQAKGYTMIQIDDGWQSLNRVTGWIARENYPRRPSNTAGPNGYPKMAGNGNPGCTIPNPVSFPRGMKALGDDIKANGFRFGLYTGGAKFVCDEEVGFRGFYTSSPYANLHKIDAQCFREWGIDLLKVDACSPESRSTTYYADTLKFWRGALDDHVILYGCRFGCMAKVSCNSVYDCPQKTVPSKNKAIEPHCAKYTDLARSGLDVKPVWNRILDAISTRFGRGKVSRPGFWVDPDYLVPHMTHLHFVERRSQFSMWCITSSPLLISIDLDTADKSTLNMLMDDDALQVNQVYEGDGGDLVRKTGTLWEFQKRFAGKKSAYVVTNVGANTKALDFTLLNAVTWKPTMSDFLIGSEVTCTYFNVWTKEIGTLDKYSEFEVYERDTLFLLVDNCYTNGQAMVTLKPTSAKPTARLTKAPTARLTKAPTAKPSKRPTTTPTTKPTKSPTAKPTKKLTLAPTSKPTLAPTSKPTLAPTSKPSKQQPPTAEQPSQDECVMESGTTYRTCNAKLASCKMKWIGLGCLINGSRVGGGCRCNQFCGYLCKDVCNRDKQCFWGKDGKCYNAETKMPGEAAKSRFCTT